MKNIVKSYIGFLNEDGGVSYATQGSATGMGAVLSPTANTCPGVPGDAGSGDFGSSFLPTKALKNTIYKTPSKTKKTKNHLLMNQLKSGFNKKPAGKAGEISAVKSFADFITKM